MAEVFELVPLLKLLFPKMVSFDGSNFETDYAMRLQEFNETYEDLKDTYGDDFLLNPLSVEQARLFSRQGFHRPSIFALHNGNIRFVFDGDEYSAGVQFLGGDEVQVIITTRTESKKNI